MSAMWFGPLLPAVKLLEQSNVTVTGVSAETELGFVSLGNPVSATVGTSSLGTVTINAAVNVTVIGLAGITALGAVGAASFEIIGVEGVSGLGMVEVSEGASIAVEVLGVNANISLGNVRSWSDIPNSQATRWVLIS